MKTTELMIGDLVQKGDKVITVSLENFKDHKDFKPIKLTEEILEKNGFKKKIDLNITYWQSEDGRIELSEELSNHPQRSWNIHIDSEDFCTIGSGCAEYVHELQNVILVITGKPLMITL